MFVVLPDIRSAQNVGAIFRTCDGAGVSKIFLTGYTPAPIDEYNRARSDISKAALGAEKTIVWEKVKSLGALLKKFKASGVKIVAIEQSPNSVDYKKVKIGKNESVAFILGNEVDGLPKSILSKCDVVAEIPMKGEKESLNVSVSAGIALFRILNI